MAKTFGVDPARTMIVERGSAVGSTFDKWPAEVRFITSISDIEISEQIRYRRCSQSERPWQKSSSIPFCGR
jgi:hypothetical protein